MAANRSSSQRMNKRKTERWLALAALALIAIVWVLGSIRAQADQMTTIRQTLPEANRFENEGGGLYAAWAANSDETLIGYVVVGTANGYGGPLELAVAVNPEGVITNALVMSHKETPAWMDRVQNADFLATLTGKAYSDPFRLGEDLDAVTGATYTTRALAEAALQGSRAAAERFGFTVTETPPPAIQFGIPEIVLLALFAVGYVGHQRGFKYKKQVRWGSMLVGLVVLGFIYNMPLTLAYFNKLILGYWPAWQTNLYWYFLIGGLLFVFTVDNKNPYCEWFCPFGAAQECLGAIGGAKVRIPRRHKTWLQWAQRLLALSAVLLGVFFRSPGLGSYELFGTLFGFVGTSLQFVALALVLVASLFIRRPWCTYLCPLHAVVEFIRIIREWVKELWAKINPRAKTA